MARDFLFIAMTGQTDIQVVITTQEGSRRFSISKRYQQLFHSACVGGKIPWRMRSFAETEGLWEERHVSLHYDEAANCLQSVGAEDRARQMEMDCSQGVELCAPLLAECWRQLRDETKLGRCVHVVLLTTQRDPPEATEPIGVFQLSRTELARAFQLSEQDVEERVFLRQGDAYETDERGQRHLRADVARLIDEKLQELTRTHREAVAVVSDVAGVPEVKPVLAASANYRFADIRFLRPTERRRSDLVQKKALIDPAESLRVRSTVARLVRRGDVGAAAALASHRLGDLAEKLEPWRRWLRYTASVLEGMASDGMDRSLDQYPDSATCRHLRQILDGGPTLLVAMRTEVALQRRSWSTALSETFTFLDMAEQEFINRRFARPGQLCLDWTRNVFYVEAVIPLPTDVTDYIAREHAGRRAISLYRARALMSLLRKALPASDQQLLGHFNDTLRSVREFRNVRIHASLDSGSIAQVRFELREAGMWLEDAQTRFLDGAQTLAILNAFGHTDPGALYQGLIQAIQEDIDAFSFRVL